MTTSRQKILNYIIEKQSVTVDELSKIYRVTPANIRHHLSILIEQGSIKAIGQKSPQFKGRPTQIYGGSQQSDQNNLDRLSEALLTELFLKESFGDVSLLIKNLAKHLGSMYKTRLSNPTSRLYSAIHSLNRMKYQAHWEAHVENPRIMLGHCPYRAILDKYPELCQMDTFLLEELLDAPISQIEKLTPTEKDLPQCVFLLRQAL